MKKGQPAKLTSKAKRAKRTKKPSVFIVVPLILVSFFVIFATIYKITEFIITQNLSQNFPTLEISLTGTPIEQINAGPKDAKYPGNTITLAINNKTITYENVEIRGRGNSTWWQIKKPYQIKLAEKNGLFGYKASKKWVLLADYQDETHLRNDTAFFLNHLLNAETNINGHHLELYVDKSYYGLYYLSEKVEIDKNRLNLKAPDGIIVEIDNLHNLDETCSLHSDNGDCLVLHDIVNTDYANEAMATFVGKINRLELATARKDFSVISEIIDVDSFIKYFLVKEFANDQDAYGSSFFLYSDGEDDKIHAGPSWDFDAAFGNKHLGEESKALSPFEDTIFKNISLSKFSKTNIEEHALRISNIIYNLLDVPGFEERVKEIYQQTLSGHGEELLEYIESQANYIRDAAYRDQKRWKLKTDFDEEIDYLIDWVAKRYDHFEQTYGANSDVQETTPAEPADLDN